MADRIVSLPMSEADYQGRILDYALVTGWRAHHCRPLQTRAGKWQTPITGHAGFPDLILARGPRLVVLEVKRDGEQPTPEQRAWLSAFMLVPGAQVHIATPSTWDFIERLLR